MTKQDETLAVMRGVIEKARQAQHEIDVILAPEPTIIKAKRRPPRIIDGPIIEIRLKGDTEEHVELAREIVEQALKAYQARLQRARRGTNPKYADEPPKYMTYGDFVLPGKRKARR